jgi:septin family protein
VLSFLLPSVIQANVEGDDEQKETKDTCRKGVEEEEIAAFDEEIDDSSHDKQREDAPKTQPLSRFWLRHRPLTED